MALTTNFMYWVYKPTAKWPKDLKRTNIKAFVAENADPFQFSLGVVCLTAGEGRGEKKRC